MLILSTFFFRICLLNGIAVVLCVTSAAASLTDCALHSFEGHKQNVPTCIATSESSSWAQTQLHRGQHVRGDAMLQTLSRASLDSEVLPLSALAQGHVSFSDAVHSGINMTALIQDRDRKEREKFTLLLSAVISKDPPSPINLTRRPFDIEINCSGFFSGRRHRPVKVVDLIPFGYELDALEWRLFELDQFVDTFVILESPMSHHLFKKPMLFAASWTRFAQFQSKVIYLNDDDSEIDPLLESKVRDGVDWRMETRMRQLLWERYVESQGGLSNIDLENTIFIHGDPDEIPSAVAMAHFKHCKPREEPLDAYLKFTLYRHNFEYVWHQAWWNAAVYQATREDTVARRKGSQPYDQHPSAHANRVSGPYGNLYKDLTISELGAFPSYQGHGLSMSPELLNGGDLSNANMSDLFATGSLIIERPVSAEDIALNPEVANAWQRRGIRTCCPGDSTWVKRASSSDYVPWLAKYNPERYPYAFPSLQAPL